MSRTQFDGCIVLMPTIWRCVSSVSYNRPLYIVMNKSRALYCVMLFPTCFVEQRCDNKEHQKNCQRMPLKILCRAENLELKYLW